MKITNKLCLSVASALLFFGLCTYPAVSLNASQTTVKSQSTTSSTEAVSLKAPYKRLKIGGVETRLREMGQRLNIPKVHPHKFRRTLLTDAGSRGIPLQEIQAYAGHKKPDTNMMYVTVNEDNVKASFRRYIA